MEYTPPKPPHRNTKKIILLAIASVAVIGLIGYGTVTLLHKVKAPTISTSTQPEPQVSSTPAPTPEKALETANKARSSAIEKATTGDQKAALVDYKTAYENYKLAKDTSLAEETKFTIDSIEAALAAPKHPATSLNAKSSAKE